MSDRIGFMQGRLSPVIGGRIQAFPWACWQEEFELGQQLGFRLMEWTLDWHRLNENPLLTSAGRDEIRRLCQRHEFTISSVTGDCFMQAPFWKAQGVQRDTLQRDFLRVANTCATGGISVIVVPLVDEGRVENTEEEDVLVAFLQESGGFLANHRLRIAFESDFDPPELARFIGRLDPALFGVNYDTGNSAALGFNPSDELAAYGHRIFNVHIKDRRLGGTTVPLGSGNVDFDTACAGLARVGYAGNYILQTARDADGDHAGALCRYRDMTAAWLNRHGA